jgi:methyl-accepting chemotaxis protein
MPPAAAEKVRAPRAVRAKAPPVALAGAELDKRQLLIALKSFRNGDFSARLPKGLDGMDGEIADAFNEVVDLADRKTREFARLGEAAGKQGRIEQRVKLPGAQGSWSDNVETINELIADLVHPTVEYSRVIAAVARGDLGQTIDPNHHERPLKGEFLRIGKVVNTMVDQLNGFAGEVTRVAREVGTEGKLGGQAKVKGAAGTWKDLTDNVNAMAANLTGQVRTSPR